MLQVLRLIKKLFITLMKKECHLPSNNRRHETTLLRKKEIEEGCTEICTWTIVFYSRSCSYIRMNLRFHLHSQWDRIKKFPPGIMCFRSICVQGGEHEARLIPHDQPFQKKMSKHRKSMKTHGNSGILFDMVLGTNKFINTQHQSYVLKISQKLCKR